TARSTAACSNGVRCPAVRPLSRQAESGPGATRGPRSSPGQPFVAAPGAGGGAGGPAGPGEFADEARLRSILDLVPAVRGKYCKGLKAEGRRGKREEGSWADGSTVSAVLGITGEPPTRLRGLSPPLVPKSFRDQPIDPVPAALRPLVPALVPQGAGHRARAAAGSLGGGRKYTIAFPLPSLITYFSSCLSGKYRGIVRSERNERRVCRETPEGDGPTTATNPANTSATSSADLESMLKQALGRIDSLERQHEEIKASVEGETRALKEDICRLKEANKALQVSMERQIEARRDGIEALKWSLDRLASKVQEGWEYPVAIQPDEYWQNKGYEDEAIEYLKEGFFEEMKVAVSKLEHGVCEIVTVCSAGHDEDLMPHWKALFRSFEHINPYGEGVALNLLIIELNEQTMRRICNRIRHKNISRISFCRNGFTNMRGAIIELGKALESPQLKHFTWSENPIESIQDMNLLTRVLSQSNINELTFRWSSNENAQALLSGINFSRYKLLNLGGNNLQTNGRTAIPDLIAANAPLVELYLDSNKLNDDDAVLIAQSLGGNTHLRRLNVENNDIQARGMRALYEAVNNTSTLNTLSDSNHTCLLKGLSNDFDLYAINSDRGSNGLYTNRILKIQKLMTDRYRRGGGNVPHLNREMRGEKCCSPCALCDGVCLIESHRLRGARSRRHGKSGSGATTDSSICPCSECFSRVIALEQGSSLCPRPLPVATDKDLRSDGRPVIPAPSSRSSWQANRFKLLRLSPDESRPRSLDDVARCPAAEIPPHEEPLDISGTDPASPEDGESRPLFLPAEGGGCLWVQHLSRGQGTGSCQGNDSKEVTRCVWCRLNLSPHHPSPPSSRPRTAPFLVSVGQLVRGHGLLQFRVDAVRPVPGSASIATGWPGSALSWNQRRVLARLAGRLVRPGSYRTAPRGSDALPPSVVGGRAVALPPARRPVAAGNDLGNRSLNATLGRRTDHFHRPRTVFAVHMPGRPFRRTRLGRKDEEAAPGDPCRGRRLADQPPGDRPTRPFVAPHARVVAVGVDARPSLHTSSSPAEQQRAPPS
ncbi:hypothetical protein THAOC_33110, partial [Thalassiosira oceanica]